MMKNIEDLRTEIDTLDEQLLELLQRRAALSVEVGALKQGQGIYDPSRERDILERLAARLRPPLTREMLAGVFGTIFSLSRGLQTRRKVAFFGPEGSYTHSAALAVFALDAELCPQDSIESVIQEVLTGRAELGVVPVENSTEGMINQTLDLMAATRLCVCREILLPIRHCLLSRQARLADVLEVFSHPQALAQCRTWLGHNLPQAAITETASTSEAARAVTRRPKSAAVASEEASRLYGLSILAADINDVPNNITRFWVVAREGLKTTGRAKTSIIVTLQNKPGALYQAIGIFAGRGINLSSIKSRPSRTGPWEYLFFIDFEGSLEQDTVSGALEDLKTCTNEIIVLGSYPDGRYNP